MTETNPGDVIYLTKRAKALGAVVKVRVTENDRAWWEDAKTSSGQQNERYVRIGQFEATEQAARDKAEELIAKEIASLERKLTKLRGFLGNIKLIDRT